MHFKFRLPSEHALPLIEEADPSKIEPTSRANIHTFASCHNLTQPRRYLLLDQQRLGRFNFQHLQALYRPPTDRMSNKFNTVLKPDCLKPQVATACPVPSPVAHPVSLPKPNVAHSTPMNAAIIHTMTVSYQPVYY